MLSIDISEVFGPEGQRQRSILILLFGFVIGGIFGYFTHNPNDVLVVENQSLLRVKKKLEEDLSNLENQMKLKVESSNKYKKSLATYEENTTELSKKLNLRNEAFDNCSIELKLAKHQIVNKVDQSVYNSSEKQLKTCRQAMKFTSDNSSTKHLVYNGNLTEGQSTELLDGIKLSLKYITQDENGILIYNFYSNELGGYFKIHENLTTSHTHNQLTYNLNFVPIDKYSIRVIAHSQDKQ